MVKRKAEVIDLTVDDDVHQPHSGKAVKAFRPKPQDIAFHDDLLSQNGTSRSTWSGFSDLQTHDQAERDSWPLSTQAAEADMRREIDLTQDSDGDNDTYENFQLYGVLNGKIVGCQYYDGRATVGEYVVVRREPRNPYDRNAIRIDNVMRKQIGHLPRTLAAKLAPLIDSGELKVEGDLIGHKTSFDCPIGLKLFGTSDPMLAAQLKAKMQQLKLPVTDLIRSEKERKQQAKEMDKQRKAREKAAAAMQKDGNMVFDPEGPNKYSNLGGSGSPDTASSSLEELLSTATSYNPRELQDVVNKFSLAEDALAKMDMAEQPDRIATKLLPYQRQGLKWMLDHESPRFPQKGSNDTVQLWKNSNGHYLNIATSFAVSKAPDLASGGILADDMGLGKTLQIISLIMADPKRAKEPTLIVTPLSVMSNWRDQAAQHVKTKYAPRVLIYHGQEARGLRPSQFDEYDIVVTTYQTMTIELFPNGKDKPKDVPAPNGLFSVHWRRVVLDEGHQIRNPKAKMSRAACALIASSRWILTGTPIVNSLKDLYSHIKFLRLSGGLDEYDIFNGTLIRPLKNGKPEAKVLLQALMSTLCLRRMKDMKFVDLKLPGIDFHKYPIQFLSHEQERYDAFKAEAVGLLEAAKAKKGENTMTNLLEVLLRLRQTCNHWKMCGEERVKRVMSLLEENKAVDVMKPENRKALQDLLQLRIDSQEDCPVCMDNMTNPMITACAHAFCNDCISRVIETQHKCPMCRATLEDPTTTLVAPAANFGEMDGDNEDDIDADTTSSKIEALMKIVKTSVRDKKADTKAKKQSKKGKSKAVVKDDDDDNENENEDEYQNDNSDHTATKTVIFSQWTAFLSLLEPHLQAANIPYARLDGKMNALQRDASLTTFTTDPSVRILLASLSVCSVGINLVAANNVILADSWWAPAIEDQAVDRVYRLGQTKKCKVVRLVVEGTIEDEVLAIQQRKRSLAAQAFGEKNNNNGGVQRGKGTGCAGAGSGTLNDIARLLQ